MRDIRIKMWCKDGVPFRFQLEFNGVPQARQHSPVGVVFGGISERVVMLDEYMGPEFIPLPDIEKYRCKVCGGFDFDVEGNPTECSGPLKEEPDWEEL